MERAVSAADNKKLMEQLFAGVAAGDRKPFLDRIEIRLEPRRLPDLGQARH